MNRRTLGMALLLLSTLAAETLIAQSNTRRLTLWTRGREVQGGGDMTDIAIKDDFLIILYSYYFTWSQGINLPLRLKDGTTLDLTLQVFKEISKMESSDQYLKVVSGPLYIDGRKEPVEARTTFMHDLTEIDRNRWKDRAKSDSGRVYLEKLAVHELLVRLGAENSLETENSGELVERALTLPPIHSTSAAAGGAIGEFKRGVARTRTAFKSKEWQCTYFSSVRPGDYDQYYGIDGCGGYRNGSNPDCKETVTFSNSPDNPLGLLKSPNMMWLDGNQGREFTLSADGTEWVSRTSGYPAQSSKIVQAARFTDDGALIIEYSDFGVIEWPLTSVPKSMYRAVAHQYPPSIIFPQQRFAIAYEVCQ